jgi:hypothetical protein
MRVLGQRSSFLAITCLRTIGCPPLMTQILREKLVEVS